MKGIVYNNTLDLMHFKGRIQLREFINRLNDLTDTQVFGNFIPKKPVLENEN